MTPTGYLVGYARVSTVDQNPQLQLDALEKAGCASVFVDGASGARTDRPQLAATMDYLRREDTLGVWRLDRLGRSYPHLNTRTGPARGTSAGTRSEPGPARHRLATKCP